MAVLALEFKPLLTPNQLCRRICCLKSAQYNGRNNGRDVISFPIFPKLENVLNWTKVHLFDEIYLSCWQLM